MLETEIDTLLGGDDLEMRGKGEDNQQIQCPMVLLAIFEPNSNPDDKLKL